MKRSPRLPEVLTQVETRRVLAALRPGTPGLIVRLLYVTGLRLIEALRLRIKDVDLDLGRIVVREEGRAIPCRYCLLQMVAGVGRLPRPVMRERS